MNADVELENEFSDLLSNFESMWDGHPGKISIVKHQIDLSPAQSKPIRFVLYRAGPKARELERNEIDKMLLGGVIRPTQID